MPTVSSITRQNDLLAQVSKNFFKTDLAAANDSILINAPIKTGADFLKSEFGGQPGLTTLVENYTAEKSDFKSNLQDMLNNLQKSADNLKNSVQTEDVQTAENSETAENVSDSSSEENSKSVATVSNNISTQDKKIVSQANSQVSKVTQTNEQVQKQKNSRDSMKDFAENYLVADKENQQEDNQTVSENQKGELSTIQNFVRDYNNAAEYLNEKFLSKNEGLTDALSSIGISVNDSGELSVDEKTLTNALQNDSEKVGEVMNDFVGQLDKEVSRLNQQSENLFPSIDDYANKRETDRAETLYSMQNLATAAHAGMKYNQFVMLNA